MAIRYDVDLLRRVECRLINCLAADNIRSEGDLAVLSGV